MDCASAVGLALMMSRITTLPARDAGLALLVVIIWGTNFAVIDEGLAHVPPLFFAGLRFLFVAAFCLFVPRPKVAWRWLLLIGLFTGTGQYALSYVGMADGMPSGLTALVMQAQVPLTILFAALYLRERPGVRHMVGIGVSAAGLVLVGLGRGGSVPAVAVLLVVGSAASWAVGNVLTRVARPDNGLRLVIWSSLVPPVPLFLLSLVREGARADGHSVTHAGTAAWLSLAFSVLLATIVAMGAWSSLLGRYQAERVVPFALLIPVIGLLTGWLAKGEHLGAAAAAGTVVVLIGLALAISPRRARAAGAVPDPGAEARLQLSDS